MDFVACCDNVKAICSKQEWGKFVATLQHQGLVSKKELKVLDRMWAEITEAAIATGAAKKKGAPLLTLLNLQIVYYVYIKCHVIRKYKNNTKFNRPSKQFINVI